MQLTVPIPDDLARLLIIATGGDLSRRALEAGRLMNTGMPTQ
jgi:hypothetical protein